MKSVFKTLRELLDRSNDRFDDILIEISSNTIIIQKNFPHFTNSGKPWMSNFLNHKFVILFISLQLIQLTLLFIYQTLSTNERINVRSILKVSAVKMNYKKQCFTCQALFQSCVYCYTIIFSFNTAGIILWYR